jgi:hypothetical protein
MDDGTMCHVLRIMYRQDALAVVTKNKKAFCGIVEMMKHHKVRHVRHQIEQRSRDMN